MEANETPVESQPSKETEVRRVAIFARRPGGLHHIVADTLRGIGISTEIVGEVSPDLECDRLLLVGPNGDRDPKQFETFARFKDQLPQVVYWFTEQVPRFEFAQPISKLRFSAESLPGGNRLPANSYRRIGEVLTLANLCPDFQMHTFSDTNTQFFRRMGIKRVTTTPWGYTAEQGEIRNGARPIDVVFVGNTKPPRGRVIEDLARRFGLHGITYEIYDNGRRYNQAVYGEARTGALNRAKIMLGIPQQPWHDIHYRFLLAGANGLAVVTTSLLSTSRSGFTPQEHFIETSIRDMPKAILQLLADPQKITQLSESLAHKVRETSMADQVRKVLGIGPI